MWWRLNSGFNFGFAEITVWRCRQTWSQNTERWGTAAPAAAWMKPTAAAAARRGLKEPAVSLAAPALSPATPAAPHRLALRSLPRQRVRPPRVSFGRRAAAKKRRQKRTNRRGRWTLRTWNSAAPTLPSLIRRPWAAASRLWPTRTGAAFRQSTFLHRHFLHPEKEATTPSCTSTRRVSTARWRHCRGDSTRKLPETFLHILWAQWGSTVYKQTSELAAVHCRALKGGL